MEEKTSSSSSKGKFAIELDSESLVNKIEELRNEVAEYKGSNNKISSWATVLANRLDRLEQKHEEKPVVNKFDSDGNKLTLDQIRKAEQDARMCKMATAAAMVDVLSLKETSENKLNVLGKEIDRAGRSINQLPTAEIVATVAGAVRTVQFRIREAYDDIESDIELRAGSLVVKEVNILAEAVYKSKIQADAEVEQIVRRGQWFQQDLDDLKVGNNLFTSGCTSLTKESEEVVELATKELIRLSDTFDKKTVFIGEQIDALKKQEGQNLGSFNLVKMNSKVQVQGFEDTMKEFERTWKTTDKSANKLGPALQTLLDDILFDMKDYNKSVEEKKKTFKLKMASWESQVEDLQNYASEKEEWLETMKELNLIEFCSNGSDFVKQSIEKHDDIASKLSGFTRDNRNNSENFADVVTRVDNITIAKNGANSFINERIEAERTHNSWLDNAEVRVRKLEASKTDYLPLTQDLGSLREMLARIDLQLKVNDKAMHKLVESYSNQDAEFEKIVEKITLNKEAILEKSEGINEALSDKLQELQEHNEELLQFMNDAMELQQELAESARLGIMSRGMSRGDKKKKKNGGGDGDILEGSETSSDAFGEQAAAKMSDDVPADVGLDDEKMESVFNIAHVCTEYENESVEKRYVYDMPYWAREVVASCCQKLAKSIAQLTDSEIIYKKLGDGDALVAEDNSADNYNATIGDLRIKKLDLLCQEIERIARNRNPQTGKFRLESRAKFIKMTRKALDLFMSKHDQILTVGNSRFGRIKCNAVMHGSYPAPSSPTRGMLYSMAEESGGEDEDRDNDNDNNASNYSFSNPMLSIEMAGGDSVTVSSRSRPISPVPQSPRTPRGSRVQLPPLTPSDMNLSGLNSSFQSYDNNNDNSFLNSSNILEDS